MDECIFVNIESLSRLKRPVNVFSVRAILCNYFRLTAESDGEWQSGDRSAPEQ